MKSFAIRTAQAALITTAALLGMATTCLHFPDERLNGIYYDEPEPLQWTPDGTAMVAGLNGTIHKVYTDRVALTTPHQYDPETDNRAHSPSLSPTGDRMVYSRKITDRKAPNWPGYTLFVSKIDGSEEKILSEDISDGRAPVWSPDGTTIAFKHNASSDWRTSTPAVINVDGTNLRILDPELTITPHTLPVWSPDGNHLAFLARPLKKENQRRLHHIYTVNRDGTKLTKVGENAATAPGWSPDSKSVVYGEADKGAPHQKRAVVIHQVTMDGSETEVLFRSARSDDHLPSGPITWLKHTNRILFSGNSISILNLDDRSLSSYDLTRDIDGHVRFLTNATPSPDETKIAVVVTGNKPSLASPYYTPHPLVMNLDGSDKRTLISWNPQTGEPQAVNALWQPERPFTWRWTDVPADGCPPDINCESRNVSGNQIASVKPTGAAFDYERETPTVEELLELGLGAGGASPTHIAARATVIPNSVRCQHRPVARTKAQREQAIRYWLNLADDAELPTSEEIQQTVAAQTATAVGAFQPVLKASFTPLAQGGLNDEYRFLTCYGDFMVTEYLLGTGPDRITVAYDRRTAEPTLSYSLYQEAHDSGYFGNQPLMTTTQYQSETDRKVLEARRSLDSILDSRNAVIFLAPMAAHHTIAVEAWQTIAQWEIQTDEQGTLLAVRHGVPSDHGEYSQTLANLTSRITTAAASDAHSDTRIANVSGLNQYYRDIGAYDDIAPDDGSDATFMPAMPPPVPTCAGSAAVGTDPDQGLVDDCNALLEIKDTLAGTATLNWSKDLVMTSWDGIRLGGTPRRVQFILLTGQDLDGSIPALLGNLTELRRIDLDENSLTGEIPPQLGMLKKLTHLYLQDNELSGELPPELGAMTALQVLYPEDNDLTGQVPEEIGDLSNLTQLVLADNQLSGPLPESLGDLSRLGHLRLRDNDFTGQIPRALSALNIRYLGLSGNDFTGCLPTGLETGGNDDLWRPELAALPNCGPSFGETQYAFSLAATEPAGTDVGTVSAAPYETGDAIVYSIVAGNEDGLFAVDSGTGAITLAMAATAEDEGSYTLTVEAEDGHGQKAEVTVTVSLTT